MRLRVLDIRQLPGVGPFRVDGLAAGANLITGPNAVGKSSLLRALRHLIAGARPDDPPALALSAELVDDDEAVWRVQRAGSQVAWSRDGQITEPPPLPDPDQLHCYWLRVEDLLKTDSHDDAHLVRQLRNALAGGFDLDAIRVGAPFDYGPLTGRRQAAELQAARKARRDIENSHLALRREAEGLAELEAQLAAADEAGRRLTQFDRALGLLAAHRERVDAQTRLAEFPEDMARLHGRELHALAELERERSECAEAAETQERARHEAADRLADTGLAQQRPTEAAVRSQHEHLAERTRLADRLDGERQTLNERLAAEQRAARDLGAIEPPPRLDPDSVDAAQALAIRLHRARHARDERRTTLEAWDTATAGSTTRTQLGWAALAAVGTIAAAIAAALAINPWGAAAAVVAASAGLLGLIAAGRAALTAHRADDYHARRNHERANELERAEAALTECEHERERFCTDHGIDPERFEGAGLERFIHLAADLDGARQARMESERVIASLESKVAEQAQHVRDFLTQWQAAVEGTDGVALKTALDAFEARCRRAAEAATEQRDAERQIERLRESLTGIDQRIARLYADAGLEPGARQTLEVHCAAFEQWQQCRDAHNKAQNIEEERRRPLTEEPALIARVEADDETGLQAERDRLAQQADERESLRERIDGLQHRLDHAGRERELERADAAEARARDALDEQLDQALLAAAGHLLLDQIAAEYHSAHEPAVLADARARFAHFTHHAWSLEVDPEQGFRAVDHTSEERRALAELSSGTRMQLLLAVRIAWARQIEREKTPLPLFLDEALTTSDEARFGEVAATLERLIEDEGRQVFYLSARRQEAALWERATGHAPHLVDLAAIRFGRSADSADDYALPEREALPAPDGRSPEQYAADLGVPMIDPRAPAAAMHPFHLLRDDLPLLYTLMEHWRIRDLGALDALLDSEVAERAVPDASMRETLRGRGRAAREWSAIWRQGRGRPVDQIVLEGCDAVGPTFLDRVADRARLVGGDPAALIDSLHAERIERFGETRIARLDDWFRSNGYIDPADPLDAAERERQALHAAAGHGRPEDLGQLVRWLEAGAAATDVMAGAASATVSA